MPLLPTRPRIKDGSTLDSPLHAIMVRSESEERRAINTRVRNRRKRYLDTHPEYFSSALELADPLSYDRLVRRFQSTAEREAEGREKGYSGTLEADLLRSEAKIEALAHPDPNAPLTYKRGPRGEILAEDPEEIPASKEEGLQLWRKAMELRFLRGDDDDFSYQTVDDNPDFDDLEEETRDAQDMYFDAEDPSWAANDSANGDGQSKTITGETGVQDF